VTILVVLPLLLGVGGIIAFVGVFRTFARLVRADMNDNLAIPVKRAARLPLPYLADSPDVPRLQRFDRTVLRTASTSLTSRQRQTEQIGAVTYVLRDSGRDRLEILAVYSSEAAGSEVLPITVTTPERRDDYLLIFRAEDSGKWVAVVEVPGIHHWADVFVHDTRERASLTADDAETVARSVRAVPDLWVPAWQGVARARSEGDPVRKAIGEALRA
jgi:hypothetical protein